MDEMEIPARPGIKVFVNEAGTISIQQTSTDEGIVIVTVHPQDVPDLIEILDVAKQNAERPD